MALPNWVLAHRQPKTEIRFIKGHYYVYDITYKYDPVLKRTKKVTGKLKGKLTEDKGFTASDKALSSAGLKVSSLSVFEFGGFELFEALLAEEAIALEKEFGSEAKKIMALAMLRWIYHSPIKNMGSRWEHSYYRHLWDFALNDKQISALLHALGEKRAGVIDFMKSLKRGSDFLLIDSTHITSESGKLKINTLGYDPRTGYQNQFNLMLIYSASLELPVYYRILPGNIKDVSFRLSLLESGIKEAVVVADKGFYSENNIAELKKLELKYIIPLRRNSSLINYEPIKSGNRKDMTDFFTFQKSVIWYYISDNDGRKRITYLNERLASEERNDYLTRIATCPETHDKDKFFEKQYHFGTFTLTTNLEQSAQTLYETYKSRCAVEQAFDTFKNLLHADRTYMQNEQSMEGWMLIHFLCLRAYYKLYHRLKEKDMLSKYSPDDILRLAQTHHKCKINGEWTNEEITAKTAKILNELK